jgi:hypothetical protein
LPLPVSTWLSLCEALKFVIESTGEDETRVRKALRDAGLTGKLTATGCLHLSASPDPKRYFAHPALANRETIPPENWGLQISWPESRIGRHDMVQLNRVDIEPWLAAINEGEQPRGESRSPQTKKGNKPWKVDALVDWLRNRYETRPPMSVDELMRSAKLEVVHIGIFGKRTFENAIAKAFPRAQSAKLRKGP